MMRHLLWTVFLYIGTLAEPLDGVTNLTGQAICEDLAHREEYDPATHKCCQSYHGGAVCLKAQACCCQSSDYKPPMCVGGIRCCDSTIPAPAMADRKPEVVV
eukprot:TRINITY_DN3601_c0_g1_i1.p2 TRINITY_DN3601_c0_g1~~TRINITY_DN3601_c0_g1_i1.p2  ORF type:complete len:102 (-),score=10.47 TRINITY_DN3601_c0_g1_i1:5-310(-)